MPLFRLPGVALMLTLIASVLVGSNGRCAAPTGPVALTVVNPGFEALTGTDPAHFDASGHLLDGHYSAFNFAGGTGFNSADALPGWTGTGSAGTFNPATELFPSGIPEGRNTAWINAWFTVKGHLGQTLPDVFQEDRLYRLSVDVGAPAGLPFPGYFIGLYADGQPVAGDTNTVTVPIGGFATATVSVSLPAGSPFIGKSIEIRIGIPDFKPDQTDFDNVRLTVEPTAAEPPPVVTLPVVNPSFEALTGADPAFFDASGRLLLDHYSQFPGYTPLPIGFNSPAAIPGWSGHSPTRAITAGTINYRGSQYFPNGNPDGQNCAFINYVGYLSQTLPDTFQANRRYRLSVDIGVAVGVAFPGYVIGLYANGQAVATDANTVAVPAGGFATASVAFTLPAGSSALGAPIEIRLGIPGDQPDQTVFDNVRLTMASEASSADSTVQPSPVAIVTQPASKTVLWGTEATFSVAATGTAPLTYQWRFKGADIPGATGPQLFVGAVGKVSAGDYSVTVCNPVGCVTSAPATLTVTPGPAIIRAINSTTKAPEILSVPIVLEANGVENALSFTLRFDPEQLDYQGASRSGAGAAQLLINDSRADEGLLGVVLALPAGGKFPEGVQEVLRLNFRPAPALADSTRALRFTDDLTLRQLADADAKSLGSGWVDGYARVIAADYEGDVSPAPGGDKQVTVTDWVLIGRYVAGLEGVPTGSAFQRADCAPLSASGNGRLTVADWVQAGRFAVGLDPVRSAGGPLNPTTPPVPTTRGGPLPHALENRAVSLSEGTSQSGEAKEIVVRLAATGDENALAFSVSYDPAALRFLGASIGADATQAMLQINMQQAAEGRVGLALALTTGANFSAGNLEVAKLRFAAVAGPADSAELSFTDAPVFREIAAPSAETLPSAWVGTSVGVVPATLTVSRTQTPDGPAIVLAWPAALAGAGLETTDGLDTAWEPVAVAPVVKDGRNTVTLPLSDAAGWYRLKLP